MATLGRPAAATVAASVGLGSAVATAFSLAVAAILAAVLLAVAPHICGKRAALVASHRLQRSPNNANKSNACAGKVRVQLLATLREKKEQISSNTATSGA